MPHTIQDPRDRITEQAFRVEPELLGLPLASPTRRLIALLLDLLAAAALATALGAILLIGVGVLFLLGGIRTTSAERLSRIRKWSLIVGGAVVLGLAAAIFSVASLLSAVDVDALTVGTATTSTVARAQARRRLLEQAAQFVPDGEDRAKLERAIAQLSTRTPSAASSKASDEAGDEDLSDGLRADPTLTLEPKPEDEGVTAETLFTSLLDTIGLTFGWVGAYFTVFLTLGRGQTPAKRLLGVRVVRLDGQPIGFWGAFERFSGLGAGLATGLLGFLQIYWDGNRQAIHDKISNTVVIRHGAPRLQVPPTELPEAPQPDAPPADAPPARPPDAPPADAPPPNREA